VADTLNYVLSGECDDDVLRGLYVEGVDPAPDESRLLVTVSPLDVLDRTPPETVLMKLMSVSGKLRNEVAAAITRRKTPELAFRYLRPEDRTPPPPETSARPS
jgi:ribosome-binding factor A